jgi:hypothetical protein
MLCAWMKVFKAFQHGACADLRVERGLISSLRIFQVTGYLKWGFGSLELRVQTLILLKLLSEIQLSYLS